VLVRSNVTIADEDKLQFYLEEMYDSYHFDKNKMLDWDQQATATKTNYKLAKHYFEALVKATNTYKQNAGGGTAGQNKYKSANQLADCGDKIHYYITQIASAAAANNDYAANTQTKDTQFDVMLAQIRPSPRPLQNLWQTRATQTPIMAIKATARNGASRGDLSPTS
jgi:hypothetical protein